MGKFYYIKIFGGREFWAVRKKIGNNRDVCEI